MYWIDNFGQNIAGSFFESRSSTSVTRDGDVDLHGHIECLKEKVEVSKYTQRSVEYSEIFI